MNRRDFLNRSAVGCLGMSVGGLLERHRPTESKYRTTPPPPTTTVTCQPHTCNCDIFFNDCNQRWEHLPWCNTAITGRTAVQPQDIPTTTVVPGGIQ